MSFISVKLNYHEYKTLFTKGKYKFKFTALIYQRLIKIQIHCLKIGINLIENIMLSVTDDFMTRY